MTKVFNNFICIPVIRKTEKVPYALFKRNKKANLVLTNSVSDWFLFTTFYEEIIIRKSFFCLRTQ